MYRVNAKNGTSDAERPYERFASHGASALTDAELLAVILRSGSEKGNALELAGEVLKACPSGKGLSGLCTLTVRDLTDIYGIGRVKAAQLLCVAELSKRIATSRSREKLKLSDPGTVADYLMEQMRHLETEIVRCLMLDQKNRLTDDVQISSGTVDMALISPREIFIGALKAHAVKIILAHNHPSGDPSPSREDIVLTENVVSAGRVLGIALLDHIIIGDKDFFSFANAELI